MPKMRCECGNILNYGDIPCAIEYLFISDIEFDKFEDKVDTEKLYMQMKSILKCSKCNRLWVFWDGLQNKPKEYVEIPVKES